jgi:hypothetical protein
MRKIKHVLLVMIVATLACLGSGGEDTEKPATDTPASETTSTKVVRSVKKDSTSTPSAESQEEPTAVPEATESPEPTTQAEEPTQPSDEDKGYEEIVYPISYAVEEGVDIELVDVRIFRREFSTRDYIFGLIKNTGSKNLWRIEIGAGAVDAKDEIIASSYGDPYIRQLYPGEEISFSFDLSGGFPEETEKVVIVIEADEVYESYLRTHNFEVISSDVKLLSDGRYLASVRFRNNNDYETYAIIISIFFFDRNNRIIGDFAGFLPTDAKNVPAGAEAEVDFTIPFIIGDYDNYRILIDGAKAED